MEAEIRKALEGVVLDKLPVDNVHEIHGSWDETDEPGVYDGVGVHLQAIDDEVHVVVSQYGDAELAYTASVADFDAEEAAKDTARIVQEFVDADNE